MVLNSSGCNSDSDQARRSSWVCFGNVDVSFEEVKTQNFEKKIILAAMNFFVPKIEIRERILVKGHG